MTDSNPKRTDGQQPEAEPRPYANTDEQPRGFSNDDDNIRRQQMDDVADPNQDIAPAQDAEDANGQDAAALPDPGGERHAPAGLDEEPVVADQAAG